MELQATNDQRDGERETLKALHAHDLETMKLQLERYKTDQDNQTKIIVAEIAAGQRREQAQISAQTAIYSADSAANSKSNPDAAQEAIE